MEIRRDTAGYSSLNDPKPASPSKGIAETVRTNLPVHHEPVDRRRRPDRRRKQQPFAGPDRRKRIDRRQPKLFNARRLTPEKLEKRLGRLVNVKV